MTNHFASNIKLLRERKRRTQSDVADALGVPRSTYNSWEISGEPSFDRVQALEQYFGVGADVLLNMDLRSLREFELSRVLHHGYLPRTTI